MTPDCSRADKICSSMDSCPKELKANKKLKVIDTKVRLIMLIIVDRRNKYTRRIEDS